MFLLPGVPLLFYGQEVANAHRMFGLPAFDPARRMRDCDPQLWEFYQRLIASRHASPALALGDLRLRPPPGPRDPVVAFTRTYGPETRTVELHFDTYRVVVR